MISELKTYSIILLIFFMQQTGWGIQLSSSLNNPEESYTMLNDTAGGPPSLDSLTILPDSGILIVWKPYHLATLRKYIVYRYTREQDSLYADTIDNTQQNSIIQKANIKTNLNFYTYRLAYIYDSLGYIVRLSPLSESHRSLCLKLESHDTCNRKIFLRWNQLPQLKLPRKYKIYRSVNYDTGYEKFATITNADTLTFTYPTENTVYYFKIVATDDIISSTSNIIKVNTSELISPRFAKAVSVVTAAPSTLVFNFDSSQFAGKIELMENRNNFGWIKKTDIINPSGGQVKFETSIEPLLSYSWYINVYNRCSNISAVSDTISNIILNAGENLSESQLSWNAPFQNGSTHYQVIRIIGNQTETTENLTDLFYNEILDFESLPGGKVCYQVKASRDDIAWSYSNIACIEKEPLFIIPEGFTPNGDGLNDTFKPHILYIESDYQLIIINRWGQVVFSTKDLHKSWDGQYNGKAMPEGKYLYYIRIKAGNGKLIEKRGEFVLLKP